MTVKKVTAKVATTNASPEEIKKAFQKVIKAIRDDRGTYTRRDREYRYEYPKAMATKKQLEKGTATVNCGEGVTEELANMVMNDKRFQDFIKKYDLTAKIEETNDKFIPVQVRIYF